jgi:hypothetical protein
MGQSRVRGVQWGKKTLGSIWRLTRVLLTYTQNICIWGCIVVIPVVHSGPLNHRLHRQKKSKLLRINLLIVNNVDCL